MPDLHRLSSRLGGIEEFVYTTEHGRERRVRRVAIWPPMVWKQSTGDRGVDGNTVVLVDSSPANAFHYERLRAALGAAAS